MTFELVQGSKSLENSKKKIFIGGLPVNVTEEELVQHFSKYGPVRLQFINYSWITIH